MDVENEWIRVTVCASIDSALQLKMEALSSVSVSQVDVNVNELNGM